MSGRKFIAIFAVFCMIFSAVAAVAENRVEVKVTTEPVRYHATCDKAGGWSLQFDANTVLRHGDQIIIDTDFINEGQQVRLCKNIDLVIAPGPEDATANGTLTPVPTWGNGSGGPWVAPVSGNIADAWPGDSQQIDMVAPFYSIGVNTNISSDLYDGGVFFKITGQNGGDRVTIDVVGYDRGGAATGLGVPDGVNDAFIRVGTEEDTQFLVLKFFDQTTNGVATAAQTAAGVAHTASPEPFTVDGIYSPVGGVYSYSASMEDNTMCISLAGTNAGTAYVWDHQEDTKGHLDSKSDKYTFIPSEPRIAHIRAGAEYEFLSCKVPYKCGLVQLGAAGSGQGAVDACASFDNDDNTDFCTGTNNNPFVVKPTSVAVAQPWGEPTTRYYFTATVYVDGAVAQGVYFANEGLSYSFLPTDANMSSDAACAAPTTGANGGSPVTSFTNASGTAVTPLSSAAVDCTVPAANQAVNLRTAEVILPAMGAGATPYMYINLPALRYDLGVVKSGQQVTVKVTMSKSPCGELFSLTKCVATFTDSCVDTPTKIWRSLLFPYLPKAVDGYFKTGLAISNLGNNAGEVTLVCYEQDGDIFQFSNVANVAGRSIYQISMETLTDTTPVALATDGSGVWGDSQFYMVACTNFVSDGFAFLYNIDTATALGMGYLPRHINDNPNGFIGSSLDICTTLPTN